MKEFDPFRLDMSNECLWRDGERIPLTPKAFSLLAFLVERNGNLVTQTDLMEKLWPNTFVEPNVIKTHIRDLRSVLDDDARNPRFIETHHRRGYRFIAQVHNTDTSTGNADAISAHLVGQERSLATLHGIFREVCIGKPQLVFVSGEVGIGKTSLVESFERQVLSGRSGAKVLRGQCVEGYGDQEAYYPVLEAVSNLFRLPGGDACIRVFTEFAPTWLAQFPNLLNRDQHKRLKEELAGSTAERMLREFCVAIDIIARKSPIAIILEDVHWADPHTVDLFAAIARGRWISKLIVIATCRTPEMETANHPAKRLKESLLVHHRCRELKVTGLTPADLQVLLERIAPHGRVPIGLPEFLYRRCEGNPLFFEAALQQLIAGGFLLTEGENWALKTPLAELRMAAPESLSKLLGTHIESHFTELERTLLEAASVCGVTFTVALASAVAEISEEHAEELFEKLSRRGHVVRAAGAIDLPDGTVTSQYEFVHSLYRDVLYERVTRVRRSKMHKLIGLKLEITYATQIEHVATQLAYHFELASDWMRAPKYLQLAARQASERFAFDDAVRALEQALKLLNKLPEPEVEADRVKALYRIAEVYSLTDEVPRAIEALERALRSPALLNDNRSRILILMRLAFLHSRLSGSDCIAAAKEAFELSLTEGDPCLRAQARRVFPLWKVVCVAWNDAEVRECLDAISESMQCPDPVIQAQGQVLISLFQFLSAQYKVGLVTLQNAIPTLTRSGDPTYRIAERLEVLCLLYSGQFGEALKRVRRLIAFHETDGNELRGQFWKAELAWICLESLDYREVFELSRECHSTLINPGSAWVQNNCIFLQGASEVHLGMLQDAREHLAEASSFLSASNSWLHWYWKMPLYRAQTELELRSGDLASARGSAEMLLQAALATAERTWQALAWESCARVALIGFDLGRARECIDNALAVIQELDLPLASWRVHKTAAQLIKEDADHHRVLARRTLQNLANSLDDYPSLKDDFLASSEVHDIVQP